jgi:hypothetical protein
MAEGILPEDVIPQVHPGEPRPRGRKINMPNMPDMRNSRIYQYLMGTTPGDYEVQLGETLSGIGQQVGQDWQDIGESNRYATGRGPYAGSFEPSGRLPHEMQAGETLSGVRGQGKTLRSDVENVMRMPRNLLDYIRARFAKQPDLSAGGYDNMNAFEGPAYQGYQGQGPPAPSEMTAQEWRASRIPPRKKSSPWAKAKELYENEVWREPDTWRAKAKELYENAKRRGIMY